MEQKIKDIKNKYITTRDNFKRNRLFFNMKVEEKLIEDKKEELLKSDNYDSYDNAKFLIEYFSEIQDICIKTKEKYPKYGNKRIQKIIMAEHKKIPESKYDDYFWGFSYESLIYSYLLYESCGYFKVLEKEKEFKMVIMKIEKELKDILKEAKSSTHEIIKPYKTYIDNNIEKCKTATRKIINTKSKKLVKTFQNIADKTEI